MQGDIKFDTDSKRRNMVNIKCHAPPQDGLREGVVGLGGGEGGGCGTCGEAGDSARHTDRATQRDRDPAVTRAISSRCSDSACLLLVTDTMCLKPDLSKLSKTLVSPHT